MLTPSAHVIPSSDQLDWLLRLPAKRIVLPVPACKMFGASDRNAHTPRVFSGSVGSQLRRAGRRARTVSLKLRYEDFTTINRSVTLPQPVNSDDGIYEAANGLLSKLRQAERQPVRLIGVGTSNLVNDAVQLSLEVSRESRSESLSATFDKVRGKYGTRSLQTGRTAFDGTVRQRDDLFERNTGMSSQIDH